VLADAGGVGRKTEKLGVLYVDAGVGFWFEPEPEVNERPARSSISVFASCSGGGGLEQQIRMEVRSSNGKRTLGVIGILILDTEA